MTDTPLKAKLFFQIAAEQSEGIAEARRRIALDFTPIDIEGPVISADPKGNMHCFIQFAGTTSLIFISELPDIKRFAMKLENVFASQICGNVNLNVGYVNKTKVVLTSRHDGQHKICVARGVYAEVVLSRGDSDGVFLPFAWTPGNYASPEAAEFFREAGAMFGGEMVRA